MTDPTAIERQALAAIKQLRDKLDSVERSRREPIAIVGIGCRMPGAASPAAFWDLLANGRDAIGPLPADRWGGVAPEGAGAIEAGVLNRIDGFDAEFFGISPREARFTDPQQRLFLEVTWEALEDAGIRPTALKGSSTGVFVGTTTTDYLDLVFRHTPIEALDAYVVSGNTLNAVAGRVAFTLGLQGPAMAIDTACSSSLVAIDRACRSLRDGETSMALAGGVNLIIGPEIVASLAKWGMLSPASRCKTFDASADGFVRGEGCGVLVLKRLSDAERDGDHIRAVILGSAVNQDGASAGFSVPNGLAQEAVIRSALASAGIKPDRVGYVEAHGTGTPLGDPIEIEALAAVYGEGRSAGQPLLVGSVKTNVGHLEAAAGVAGLLKVVLALQHRTIPPHLHLRSPNPHIPWDR
ncbi:MAG: beta-ketoacyl synthase N-terminal-like domain-containing protein, partial [Gemmatimonadales bacterium]